MPCAARQLPAAPKVGIVSLGCPKALVHSERILTKLRAEGYEISGSYDGASVVAVNTCGFLESAKAESLDGIGEATDEAVHSAVPPAHDSPGDLVPALIEDADEYDLWAQALARG